MAKKELTPLEKVALEKFGNKNFTKQRLLGAGKKAWRGAKKLST